MKTAWTYFFGLSLFLTACSSTDSRVVSPSINCGSPPKQLKRQGLLFQQSGDADTCSIECPSGYAYDPTFSNQTPTGNCFLVGQVSNCSQIQSAETCEQVGCIELSDSSCIAPDDLENRCSNLNTPQSCNETTGCEWNSTISSCSNALNSALCSQLTNESDCENECFWNQFKNKCQSVAAACSDFENPQDCNNTNLCSWRNNNTCGTAQTSCIDRQGEDSCKLSEFCIWDDSRCLSKLVSSCSDAKSEQTCESIPTCNWDPTGVCVQSLSLCISFQKEDLCKNQGCVWDSFQCISKSAFQTCGTAETQKACQELGDGCYWDSPSATCISKNTTPCFTIENESLCKNLECIWTDKCYSPNMLCSSAGTDQNLCSQLSGCTFEGGDCISNYSCSLVKDKNDCNSFLTCGYDSNTNTCISKIWCKLPTWLGGVTCD